MSTKQNDGDLSYAAYAAVWVLALLGAVLAVMFR